MKKTEEQEPTIDDMRYDIAEREAMMINKGYFSPAYEFGYKQESIYLYYFKKQPNEDREMLKIYSRQEYNNLGMRQIGISTENKVAGLKSLF